MCTKTQNVGYLYLQNQEKKKDEKYGHSVSKGNNF